MTTRISPVRCGGLWLSRQGLRHGRCPPADGSIDQRRV